MWRIYRRNPSSNPMICNTIQRGCNAQFRIMFKRIFIMSQFLNLWRRVNIRVLDA